MNNLIHSLDRGNVSVLTLLDLSAAFGKLDHTILLQLLKHSTALRWFSSDLSNITRTVTVKYCSSAPVPLCCGVPSVLGPVLVVLYAAPLSDVIDSHSALHHSVTDVS